MSDVIISVENLGKKYRIRHQAEQRSNYKTVREVVTNGAKNLISTLRSSAKNQDPSASPVRSTREDFWALKGISFEVKRGEAIGIIGRNGAGKSTLLKILSRITEPSEGRISLRGRVASLLEVGTGFHPELTGRENIYLNGAIMGMTRAEIKCKFDEIVTFAEVEKFLDTPVKRYSSGMYVRLAFAVAAHLESEILIVDEVLAVGDAQFQKKCLGKMHDVSQSGRTVLFVSHNMTAVTGLCNKAVMMRAGQIVATGSVAKCIQAYLDTSSAAGTSWKRSEIRGNSAPLLFAEISLVLEGEQPHMTLHVDCGTISRAAHRPASVAVDIIDEAGSPIMQAIPTLDCFLTSDLPLRHFRISVILPPLVPGTYYVTVWAGPHNVHTYDVVTSAVAFEVLDTPTKGRTFPHTRDHGQIVPISTIHLI